MRAKSGRAGGRSRSGRKGRAAFPRRHRRTHDPPEDRTAPGSSVDPQLGPVLVFGAGAAWSSWCRIGGPAAAQLHPGRAVDGTDAILARCGEEPASPGRLPALRRSWCASASSWRPSGGFGSEINPLFVSADHCWRSMRGSPARSRLREDRLPSSRFDRIHNSMPRGDAAGRPTVPSARSGRRTSR